MGDHEDSAVADFLQILEEHTANAGTFRLLWPSTRYPSPKLTAFTEFMAKHLFGVTIRK